jgi:ubiquinone/menaquinone biosynthesis C-methylase UbiE
MDSGLRDSMLRYYDERAPEYEEAYTAGTGTSSITTGQVFRTEAAQLHGVVARLVGGRLLDLACGTGYWMPSYAERCSRLTLVDQSARMLAESRRKVDHLGIGARAELVQGDVLDVALDAGAYDFALVGFLLSHLTEAQEAMLFGVLRRALAPMGRFLVLESAWTPLRVPFNQKTERQARRLNDGTPFDIYKRYVDRDDIAAWSHRHGVVTTVEFFGDALCAVSGAFET